MRWAAALGALAFQLGAVPRTGPPPDPNFERYQRAVFRNLRTSGQTCVALDSAVMGHTASQAGNDLRLYAQAGGRGAQETPFALTESAAEPADTETVAISGQRGRGNEVDFDLRMPPRAYSEIDLLTEARNFIAVAEVSGSDTPGNRGRPLGTLTPFDFSREGLPASTQLRLAEAAFPWVHIKLRFMNEHGGPLAHSLSMPVFTGAQVPPSRQAQVLFTTVARTGNFSAEGKDLVAELPLEAHVPVEQVRFELAPGFKADFAGKATLTAKPEGEAPGSANETFTAELGRVNRASLGPGVPPIHYEQLTLPAALGANLRSAGKVSVRLSSQAGQPLPVKAVYLEMRQRSLCFDAQTGMSYTLRYGDAELPAPSYEYARTYQPQSDAAAATLGPEERNPSLRSRAAGTGWLARSPELGWVALIAVVALVGVLTMERLRGHHGKR